ncbi:preprotein translocase subunit SecG [Sphingobacterium sp. N143]|uniref:preprotein translocase subunit SecG n=1 Tax=Sphingobacterium sp. N143 TaxID=2746727 RepID=UPI0025771948|nr:preprotein translocase subunit SecG [Sphingobacterium sp. N143]MDM1295486.1 preprotein translocase subunit SecG [Sphingobacterium sp. N143]
MQGLLIGLIILASIILAFLVLIQNPKGGGLSSGFSGGTNLMGVKRTGDFLEKGTWIMVIAIMVFSLGVNIIGTSPSSTSKGGLGGQIEAPVQQGPLNLGNPAQKPAGSATGQEQATPQSEGNAPAATKPAEEAKK